MFKSLLSGTATKAKNLHTPVSPLGRGEFAPVPRPGSPAKMRGGWKSPLERGACRRQAGCVKNHLLRSSQVSIAFLFRINSPLHFSGMAFVSFQNLVSSVTTEFK